MSFNKKVKKNLVFDIIVVGAGPAGMAFACGFAETNIRVAIVDKLSKDDSIAVQTSLGPQFNRTNISALTQDRNGNCAPLRRGRLMTDTKYLVFAKSLNHYLIDDLEECINKISTSSDYKMLQGFRHLEIFIKFK